jgi:multiple sugar transport system permease protein
MESLRAARAATAERASARRITAGSLVGPGIRILVLLAFAVFFGVPLLWLLLAPTKTNSQLLSWYPLAFGSFQNVATAWGHLLEYNNREILIWSVNSLIYAAGSLVLTVFLCIPAGYALATTRFRGRHVLLLTTLVVMIVPGSATVLPLFLEVSTAHMLNTALSVILPAAFFPFGVYLAYIYFSTSLPAGLLEAGRIDGASEFQLFWRIALPLARPIVALVAFFSFVANWNNYFLPFVMLTDDTKYNLPVGLAVLMANAPGLHPTIGTEIPIFGPEEALAGVIVVLPILLIFIFSQRYVIAGMIAGAEKG